MSIDYVIETHNLTRIFGKKIAVDNLSLKVPRGSVFAFLGKNGAGKTTTIRMLLNLLEKSSGEIKVLEMDPATNDIDIKRRIGYVGDGVEMSEWMKVREIIWFCKGFYEDWDDEFATDLQEKLELDSETIVKNLSRGEQAKLALLLSMAYRPELLILDEPTAGLDVVVRRDFLEGIIELIQQEGRTIFFSSHIVHEVERVADWVGIIDAGKMVCCLPLLELKENVKRISMTFDDKVPDLSSIPHLLSFESTGRQPSIIVSHFNDATMSALKQLKPVSMDVIDLSLEDIFVAIAGKPEEA
jgi:ABC-2 type transport system ATP-binding protein